MLINEFIDLIPMGRENAVSCSELISLTGLSSRQVRLFIQKAREKGYPIISSCYTKGYWLTDNENEIKQFKKEQRTKALGLFKSTKKMDIEAVKRWKMKQEVS